MSLRPRFRVHIPDNIKHFFTKAEIPDNTTRYIKNGYQFLEDEDVQALNAIKLFEEGEQVELQLLNEPVLTNTDVADNIVEETETAENELLLEEGEIAEESVTGGGVIGNVAGAAISAGLLAYTSYNLLNTTRRKFENEGLVLPNSEYIGPGNKIKIDAPRHRADVIAKDHDIGYTQLIELARRTEMSNDEFIKRVSALDKTAIEEFAADYKTSGSWQSYVAKYGLKIKSAVENIIGVQYPVQPQTNMAPINNDSEATPVKRQRLDDTNVIEGNNATGGAPGIADNGANPYNSPSHSGGSSTMDTVLYKIHRPFTQFGIKSSIYTKSHKFMTFGIAPTFLTRNIQHGNQSGEISLMATALAEIPWQKPAFFLNPSEFALIPPGSYIKHIHVDVYFRGNRIAFNTNSVTTDLATLNQISNLQLGIGLNKKGYGSSMRYTSFNAQQKMKPASVSDPVYERVATAPEYQGMVADYYGVTGDSNQFKTTYPKHQLGSFSYLRNYYVQHSIQQEVQNSVHGWDNLQHCIHQFDAKTCVNKKMIDITYSPNVAPTVFGVTFIRTICFPILVFGKGLSGIS